MRFEWKCTQFPPGDSPDGPKDGDWELAFQRESEDGIFTLWMRERKPLGAQLREAQEEG